MKKYRLGIEIAQDCIHIAVVMNRQHLWKVLETAELKLEGDIQQNLRTLLKNIAPNIRQTILGLPHSRVLMKEMFLDSSLSSAEVYQFLQQQALTLFGKVADHWVMDCEAHANGFRAVAAEREYVMNWLKIFSQLKLRVLSVDVDVLALAHLAPTLTGYHPDRTQVLLWLRTDELVFAAVKTGNLIYTKSAVYSSANPLNAILLPLLQFFKGLYPQVEEPEIFIIGNTPTITTMSTFRLAELNPDIWHADKVIPSQAYCSLGLAKYGY